MKNMLLLVQVLLLLPLFLSAQYQKGELTLLNGEVLTGYIAQDTEVELKKRVHFKESMGRSAYEVYSPNEISGFRFDKGSAYESIQTSYRREEILFKERTFAKLVAAGAIDLYLSQTNIEESEFVFYARKDGRLHQLSEYEYVEDPTGYGTGTKSYYQGILNALTFDCRQRIGFIQEVPFSRKHIVETIDNYNSCQDPNYQPLKNSYKVDKKRSYFIEFFSGPIIARRTYGDLALNEQIVVREVFAMVGIAGQVETFKPSLSRNLLVHNSLEAYKWVPWQESGAISAPALSLAYNMSAHYVFSESARIKFFTRIGGTFILDIGRDILPSPGISLGMGTYFPAGGRLDIQLNAMSILGTEGISSWRLGYAIPLGSKWK
ncbi:hypothetical protein [Flavilitoribacter nigricans]|uniref:Uncharacterized protein n=1 Tax=Flavilitoribacter nigricans (strain ATCC 23147 / DSM 23189 / NBRC 102662 / NCIMB 1420 / SS-2) TaxID=1122177 RepID=A0A2D0NDV3_FLAN2|nr:hypothetical protein [Flavilitoribacter nigricans]PHN06691.1 hypothetical protein CRP01_10365 [Flavilitoribacter nigricans DSM 23189 = NBRC 102662]